MIKPVDDAVEPLVGGRECLIFSGGVDWNGALPTRIATIL